MLEHAVTARACANIALVKYWGKRDAARNLPAAGSLSLTLDALVTETTVHFDPRLTADRFTLDGGAAAPGAAARTTAFLDLVRQRAGITTRAEVTSQNHFPTASGLASSASGFAALALAATVAAGLELDHPALSALARQGSGSAARSLRGGFVRMHAGTANDGTDAFATPVPSALCDDVRMVICIVGGGAPKQYGSRDAMSHTEATSPLYRAWLSCVDQDLQTAHAALAQADLAALGAVTEGNACAMHASAIAARPSILYWQPTTVALLHAVRALRADGLAAWATMDAGPHVKVLCHQRDAAALATALSATPGVTSVIISKAGSDASIVPQGHLR